MILSKYFSSDRVKGEYFDGKEYREITFHPEISDLQYLRSFKFEDLTFRGTVEFRSVCEQPVGEIMASGALHAGLMENIEALSELLEKDTSIYHNGYNASELRRMFNKRKRAEVFDWKKVSSQLVSIVELAEDGLKKRGYGEEHFIKPLYPRAEKLLSPGRQMAEGMANGKSLEDYIEEYGGL